MGLAEVQHALARLYVERGLRERFFADPQATAKELHLTDLEAEELGRLSPVEVARFADTLARKRQSQTRQFLPWTARILGAGFARRFLTYAAVSHPQGERKLLHDALQFADWLLTPQPGDVALHAWKIDVIRYEAAWLKSSLPRCTLRVRVFRHDLRDLQRRMADVQRGTNIPEGVESAPKREDEPQVENDHPSDEDEAFTQVNAPRRRWNVAIWIRVHPRGRIWHALIACPFV